MQYALLPPTTGFPSTNAIILVQFIMLIQYPVPNSLLLNPTVITPVKGVGWQWGNIETTKIKLRPIVKTRLLT